MDASDQSSTPRYRVDHHQGDRIRTLGYLIDEAPRFVSLDPFVSQLLLHGAKGHLLLIDEATGALLVRRDIRLFAATKPRDRFRPFRDSLQKVRD